MRHHRHPLLENQHVRFSDFGDFRLFEVKTVTILGAKKGVFFDQNCDFLHTPSPAPEEGFDGGWDVYWQ